MVVSAKSLKRNNRECHGILIGPSMAPRSLGPTRFVQFIFPQPTEMRVGFRPKFPGTDGKPTCASYTVIGRNPPIVP